MRKERNYCDCKGRGRGLRGRGLLEGDILARDYDVPNIALQEETLHYEVIS